MVGLFNGAVLGIGDAVGLPRTNLTAGQQAWQQGNYLEASKLMPAGDFLGAVWDSITGSSSESPAIDPARAEAERNAALYGGTVENWLGYSYIDNDPLQLRGSGLTVPSKWGTATSAGWPWEHNY